MASNPAVGNDSIATSEATGHQVAIPPRETNEKHPGIEQYSKGDDGLAVGDVEKGTADSTSSNSDEDGQKKRGFYKRFRHIINGFIFFVMTGWWIVSLVLHRHDKNWVIPFLLWLAITLRLITLYIPVKYIMKPAKLVWDNTAGRVRNMIPEPFRIPAAATLAIAVIIVGSFVSAESADNTRENRAISLFGLIVLIFVMWATSRNRRAINWHTVIVGMLTQFIIALFVLRTGVGYDIFNFISTLARELLGFADQGVIFLTADSVADLHWFLTGVMPPIIFFVALVQLLFHWGLVQWFIGKFAAFFFWTMRVSGAEAVVAAASPFIGQGESAMLIKPFVAYCTKAEIHQIMCSGFATIAGSVLVAYIGLGVNPQALVSSCVMSIPASLALSHMRYPEEEETLTGGKVVIPESPASEKPINSLHAFANGAWLGLKIAGMIVSTLLCIIALLGLVNGLLTWWGRYLDLTGDYDLTIELILGYVCYPIAFLLGVPRGDLLKVGRLIGIKIVANEFVGYTQLIALIKKEPDLSPRTILIATYSLCGFGNIGSLGTQIGVLSQIAPGRAGDVSKLAFSALVTGILSTLSSASIAGLLVQNQAAFSQSAS
ncbi:Hypothetical protein R9X50_00445600 [Acrodontium crateriforme]|uniref:Uncharacterized protein n=1 Tax=Acrodontium crateriforme TaxID=150365 RepID=A0AAQ3M5H5_9PEZI|nr:Hypothetical protein R9X50_00445600 [Acrodontium crateriforme]